MLSKSLENLLSYGILYKFWKKAQVYYTLSISRGGGLRPPGHLPPGFDTDKNKSKQCFTNLSLCIVEATTQVDMMMS